MSINSGPIDLFSAVNNAGDFLPWDSKKNVSCNVGNLMFQSALTMSMSCDSYCEKNWSEQGHKKSGDAYLLFMEQCKKGCFKHQSEGIQWVRG